MSHQCPRCHNTQIIKSGFARGQQRFKCKHCNYQFTTDKIDRGKPMWMKLEAAILYCSGMSMNSIGKILNVSAQTILNWIRAFALENYEKPEPTEAIVVELDELWHFIESKKRSYGSGKLMTVTIADLSTGNWETVIVKPSENF